MRPAAVLPLALLATAGEARTPLGAYEGWAAFRDERPTRCFAIAEPHRGLRGSRPYLTVSRWPASGVTGQVHVRLAAPVPAGRRATLSIGGNRFDLAATGLDAWPADRRADARIIAAMRGGGRLTVSGAGASLSWTLTGAASAIDAALLGCVR